MSSDQMPSTPPQREKKSDIWKDFYENSTLHGLRNAFASKQTYLKLIWLALLLMAIGWLVNSIVNSINRFLHKPTIIEINETTHHYLDFPAITICSQSYADKVKIFAKDDDPDFTKYRLNISACAATRDVRKGRPCGHALVCAFVNIPNVPAGQLIINCTKEYKKEITEVLTKSKITFDMMEFLRTFTESLNEVLAYCNVASTGSMCTDARLYRATVQSQGGLCYTFNGEKLQDPNITQIYSDSVGTLGAITFLLQHRPHRYFYPFLTEGYNIYLHVQEAGPGVTGIFALPGKVTAVAIEKNRIKNLEISEGGKCERRTIKAFKKYSQIHCYFECASDFIKDKCVCRPVNLGEYNDATVCYNSYKNCTDYFSSQLDYGTCDCPIACDETTYKTSVSYGQLPRSSIFGINQVFFDGFSPDDYVAISVYFGSHRDVTYRQHSTFGPTSLFGEIGGNMGFLLGCSLMTLVEFVVLMWSFVMNYFQQRGQVRDLNPQPKVGWN